MAGDPTDPFTVMLATVCASFQEMLQHHGLHELRFAIIVAPAPHLDEPDACVIAGSPDLNEGDGMRRMLTAASRVANERHLQ